MLNPSARTEPAHAQLAALFEADPSPTIVLCEADKIYYHNPAGQDILQKKFINAAQPTELDISLFSQLSAPAQSRFFAEQILPTLNIGQLLQGCEVKPLAFSWHGQSLKRYSLPPLPAKTVLETDLKTVLLTAWHDIRNLLGITRNQIKLLQISEHSLSQDAIERLQKIDQASKTACVIAEKMTRVQAEQVPVQNCNDMLKSAAVILTGLLPADMQLQIEVRPQPLPVRLRQGELNNALINLVINAVDASTDGGIVQIKCDEQMHSQIGRAVCLQVNDNGCGIDDALKQKVRDAFYSNKPGRQLHGLGLFSVGRFVADAGGVMEIADNSPSGTQISLFLPLDINE